MSFPAMSPSAVPNWENSGARRFLTVASSIGFFEGFLEQFHELSRSSGRLWRRASGAVVALLQPFRFKPTPAAGNHRVRRGVRVAAFREFGGEQLRRMCRQPASEPLSMVDNRCSMLGIEDGFEFETRCRFRDRYSIRTKF